MTESEINKRVFIKLHGYDSLNDKDMLRCLHRFDPCNDPSQAWGIIYENKIDLSFGDDAHSTLKDYVMASKGDKSVTREKPFVAAMLLFLEI